jgi:uncharacterized membrane protein
MFNKNHVLLTFFITAFVAVSLPMFATSAQAKLNICNETGELRDVAIGYKAEGEWTSEGWWKVEDGECRTVIKDDLKRTFYYYRAVHKRGDFDGQAFSFCTQAKPFTIVGDKDCGSRGYNQSKFRELELIKGTTGFTLTLNDASIYEADKRVAKIEPKPEPKVKVQPKATPAPVLDGPNAPVGTHGEPYSIVGLFEGCDLIDGLLSCSFTADGWIYRAIDDGKTYEYLLNEIDELQIGASVSISGDLMNYEGNTARITIRTYDVINAAPAPSPASDPLAAPGTYGEPYDVISIFRGCNADSDENYCEFTADGWRYIVSDDGKTSRAMLDQIANFVPDQRYQIRGDLMDYGDISASVTLREFDIINDSQEQQLLNKMVGLWRSLDDPNSTIRFTPEGQQYTYYEDDFGSEYNVSLTRSCADPSVYQSGDIVLQTTSISSADDVSCYGIDLVTKDRLVLIYLPRGNFLEYEKDLGLGG